MRPALKIGLLFAGGWILLKLTFLGLNVFQDGIWGPGMINNLFLLIAIGLGLFFEKKKEGYGKGSAMDDIKAAMVGGVSYMVVISGFLFFYYRDINPAYIENHVQERFDIVYHEMQNPAYVDSLRVHNDSFKGQTDEEILKDIKTQIETNMSPKSTFVFSLLGMLLMTVTYSIFMVLIFQKILFRDYYRKE